MLTQPVLVFARLEARTDDDRNGGIARECRVGERSPTEVKGRAAGARHELHMRAAAAQPRRGRSDLPVRRAIVHDLSMFSSEAVTRGIRVFVQSEYAPDKSRPAHNEWFFLYTVRISNEGSEPVRL